MLGIKVGRPYITYHFWEANNGCAPETRHQPIFCIRRIIEFWASLIEWLPVLPVETWILLGAYHWDCRAAALYRIKVAGGPQIHFQNGSWGSEIPCHVLIRTARGAHVKHLPVRQRAAEFRARDSRDRRRATSSCQRSYLAIRSDETKHRRISCNICVGDIVEVEVVQPAKPACYDARITSRRTPERGNGKADEELLSVLV